MVLVFVDDEDKLTGILSSVGAMITAVIYFFFGKKLRTDALTAKMDILVAFVKVAALTTLVSGICSIPAWGTVIVSIIFAAIMYWCTIKMADGKATISDKVIWILLLIVFILSLIISIVLIFGIITIPLAICGIIIYGFMLGLLLDPEVKDKMGM